MPSTSETKLWLHPESDYCHLACTMCRQCLQLAGPVYLWYTVSTNYTTAGPLCMGKRCCCGVFQKTQRKHVYRNSVHRHGVSTRVYA